MARKLQFTPKRFRAQSLSGGVWRQTGDWCSNPSASWYDSNSWTDAIASSTHTFNPTGTLCTANTSTLSGSWWKWTNPNANNYKFMEDGKWEEYIQEAKYFTSGYDYYRSTTAYIYELDIYMSMHRMWKMHSDKFFTGPYTYKFSKTSYNGISSSTTEISSWSVTAGIEGPLAAGVTGSLSATYGETNITSEIIGEYTITTDSMDYDIPAGERWRFITLHGVERYTFTDSEGNPWELNDDVKSVYEFNQEPFGSIDNLTSSLHLIIKYPN